MGCGVGGVGGSNANFKIPDEVQAQFKKEGGGNDDKLMQMLDAFFKANPHLIPNSVPDKGPV